MSSTICRGQKHDKWRLLPGNSQMAHNKRAECEYRNENDKSKTEGEGAEQSKERKSNEVIHKMKKIINKPTLVIVKMNMKEKIIKKQNKDEEKNGENNQNHSINYVNTVNMIIKCEGKKQENQ